MEQKVLVKNDIIELTINALGNDGEGIGHYHGYTLFVKDAVPGDIILAKLMKTKKTYGYARVESWITKSPDRVEPRCPSARQCGGCQLQHLSYGKQLEYKQNKIRDCLVRIGGFADVVMAEEGQESGGKVPGRIVLDPIIGMEEPYHYRNKAQYPVGRGKDGSIVIGFYAERTHSIIDQKKCFIQVEGNEILLELIQKYMEINKIEPYDEVNHRGLVRHVLIRTGFCTGEIMVCLVLNGKRLPYQERLVDMLRAVPGLTGICLNVNQEKTNVILGREIIPLWGMPYITDYIGDVQFRISPLSFYQVNPEQTAKLYEKVLEYAALEGGETVWDLYCGIGTISLFLAKRAGKVYGVEIVAQAVEDARVNAELNGIGNVEFLAGAAEEILPQVYGGKVLDHSEIEGHGVVDGTAEIGRHPDVIIVDPPRKGCDTGLLDTMLDMQPKRIVYVSCDPATLARDLKYLCGGGKYEVVRAQGVDQFGHCGHIEVVIQMTYCGDKKK